MAKNTQAVGVTSDIGAFAMVPEWIIYSDLSGNAVKLYAILGRHADDSGTAYPSKRRLAGFLSCSEATVERLLKELADAGAIIIEPRYRADGGRSTNLYTVIRGRPAGEPGEGSLVSRAPGVVGDPGKNESQKEELEPVEREIALIGVRIGRRNIPWDALAEEAQATSQAYGARMQRAVESIRKDAWEWTLERWPDALERVQANPEGYERALAEMIQRVARALKEEAPTLTWGPEGIARNFRRGLDLVESAIDIDEIVADARRRGAA